MSPVFVIGDVHGELAKLLGLLHDAALIGDDSVWRGADSTLWLIGDLVDRGPEGIEVVELAMRLQQRAARAGGKLGVLLGNHDALLVSACRFGTGATPDAGEIFRTVWERNGGKLHDLARLNPDHVRWITALPAMMHEGDTLLAHADALLYARYGSSVPEVNRAMRAVVQGDDPAAWYRLLDEFSEHRAFVDGARGAQRCAAFLRRFGGVRLVHGHSPIEGVTRQPPPEVRAPLIYAGGLAVNVDGGMVLGGPGFVYRLPESRESSVVSRQS